MIPLIIYFAAAFGLAFIIGHSELTYSVRLELSKSKEHSLAWWVLKLFECPACIGFHCGWSWVLCGGHRFFGHERISAEACLMGLATCGVNLLLAKVSGLSDE